MLNRAAEVAAALHLHRHRVLVVVLFGAAAVEDAVVITTQHPQSFQEQQAAQQTLT